MKNQSLSKLGIKTKSKGGVGNKKTTEQFISESMIVHGGFYSYDKTVYKSAKQTVIITCPIHGDFEQKALNHLQGNKCPQCRRQAPTLSSNINFDNRFIYLDVPKYVLNSTVIKAKCIECGSISSFTIKEIKHSHTCKHCEREREINNRNNNKIVYYMINGKRCSMCGKVKSINEFYIVKGKVKSECKDCINNKTKIQRERISEYNKQRRLDGKCIDKPNEYYNKYYKHNPKKRIARSIACSINRCIKKEDKTSAYLKKFGYTRDEFVKHLESMFYGGMTIDNYGEVWHVDHIRPVCSFDFSIEGELNKCFALDNLQPLLAEDNLKKGCKMPLGSVQLSED